MKKPYLIILTVFVSFAFNTAVKAQCIDFVKTECFEKLDTSNYVPQGRFDALVLSQGDYLTVYKSFFRGKTYKIVVGADKNIPLLNFTVKTMQGKVVYESSENKNFGTWEYTSDRNQNLQIDISIPSNPGTKPETGCVAVVLGYKF